MKRKILVVAMITLVVFMLLSTVAPAMAKRTKLPYSIGLVGWTIEPGAEKLSANKIVHVRGGMGAQNIYGSPWGEGAAVSSGVMNLNIIDLTGSGIEIAVDTYATGTFEGLINYKITGFGLFTYNGPTFTYEGVEVEAGDEFGGVLFSGIAVKTGTSGELKGIQLRGTVMGVSVAEGFGPPQLVDKNLVYETGAYW